MKSLKYLTAILLGAVAMACSEKEEGEPVYTSELDPSFTYEVEGDIVAGETYLNFNNTTKVEGTEVARYFWHFGFSGEGNWSEDANPDPVLYKTPGEYTVKLTVWGADGNKATAENVIKVLAANVLPVAAFSYSPLSVKAGDSVTFTDESKDEDGEVISRKWLFPDGTTAEGAQASFTFASAGIFKVTLTVVDDRGAESSLTKALFVRGADVNDFTVNWSVPVASGSANCPASVVAVSGMGNIFFASGDGRILALDILGNKVWEYDAEANDGIYAKGYVAYPSVDSDGKVYWAANGVGGPATSKSVMYCFDGSDGTTPLWKNTTAYAQGARLSFMTPAITPDFVAVGNRGTSGSLKAFDKNTGKVIATVTPSKGGVNSAAALLKNNTAVMSLSGNYGYGLMVSDPDFTWSAVPYDASLTPGGILTGNQNQICIDADGCVYVVGTIKNGTWNIACFDCSAVDPKTAKTAKWTQTLDAGFNRTGASLSADGQTVYVITDKAAPYNLYALNAANGSVRWSYSLESQSQSVPAIDNLGQIHFCTMDGVYHVLKDGGAAASVVYERKVADSIDGSPTISSVDGASYFVGKDAAADVLKVYSISFPGVSGPAESAWGQYGQNPGHINYQK